MSLTQTALVGHGEEDSSQCPEEPTQRLLGFLIRARSQQMRKFLVSSLPPSSSSSLGNLKLVFQSYLIPHSPSLGPCPRLQHLPLVIFVQSQSHVGVQVVGGCAVTVPSLRLFESLGTIRKKTREASPVPPECSITCHPLP